MTAAAEGRIDVLILLGADPMTDFRDHALGARAVAGARTVIAVDTFLNASSERADVVLAAAGYAETDGTTTNVEGRVSLLSAKVTPPGTTRPDWMLAAELAYRLGTDLGLESVEGIWREFEALAPAHAGITRELLLSSAGDDGVLVPLRADVAKAAEGHPVRISGVDDDIEDEEPEVEPVVVSESRPTTVTFSRDTPYDAPGVDAYSLRLVATRRLYDLGTLVQHSPSLAALAPGSTLLVHPSDLDHLGVADGGEVTVSSPRTTLTISAHASTAIPKGSAALTVNQSGPDPADLIDAALDVTDVRIETVVP
jgi:predicted molibdopterin-dependent oxidoreductase YjgC